MKKMEGYFTVEATFVFPIVLAVITFTIYFLFFQYDRCLMEQGVAILSIRSCSLPVEKDEEIVAMVMYQERLDDKTYIAWKAGDTSVSAKGNVITVKKEGWLKYPFKGRFIEDDLWHVSATCQSKRIKPMVFMRVYRKILGGR